jgi:hypothetical protein
MRDDEVTLLEGGAMLIDADCPLDPDSNIVRCRRRRPDGGELEIGLLHFDRDHGAYRVQPAGGAIDAICHRTREQAMDALYELVVEDLYERQVCLRNELRGVREDLAVLGALPQLE